ALQSLSNNPSNQSAQSVAMSAAQGLAQQLNATTKGIQTLRSKVEQDIGNSVTQANAAISQIATLNTQLQGLNTSDPLSATLQDQRDNAINTLSKYVDIRVVSDGSNGVSVFTNSGVQLVGAGLSSQFT
ncbi:flagellar hook-associated protein FlgK, partial [Salmonella enterica subsp. enterica serovar Enteritidis]|nr:flagellar hook-associated protein FlgK [Salmonella enterica subsp. enterica serovar Enteritidis]